MSAQTTEEELHFQCSFCNQP